MVVGDGVDMAGEGLGLCMVTPMHVETPLRRQNPQQNQRDRQLERDWRRMKFRSGAVQVRRPPSQAMVCVSSPIRRVSSRFSR